jgi:transposase
VLEQGWLRNPEHWRETRDSLKEGKYEWFVEAVSLDLPTACPRCSGPAGLLKPHGTKGRRLIDLPHLGRNSTRLKRVNILVRLQRYLCARCGKSSLQPLHGVEGDERITARLKAYAAEEALLHSYKDVARLTKLAPRSVRELCAELTGHLEATERPGLSDVISVDGVYYARKERIIVTAPKRKIVVEVLRGGKAEDIIDDLVKRFTPEERKRVKVVVIDMSSKLRAAVERAFPNARVVIDRFHVFKKANEAVDGVRECLRKRRAKERREG